jgi:hypothetical protein
MAEADSHSNTTERTLDDFVHHQIMMFGLLPGRALYVLEQGMLAKQLRVRKQRYVNDKPQGEPSYLPANTKFGRRNEWVRPIGEELKWGDDIRYFVEQVAPEAGPAPSEANKKTKSTTQRLVALMKELKLKPEMLPREVRTAIKQPFKDKHRDVLPSHTTISLAYKAYLNGLAQPD